MAQNLFCNVKTVNKKLPLNKTHVCIYIRSISAYRPVQQAHFSWMQSIRLERLEWMFSPLWIWRTKKAQIRRQSVQKRRHRVPHADRQKTLQLSQGLPFKLFWLVIYYFLGQKEKAIHMCTCIILCIYTPASLAVIS